jgi:hypothetical protein
MTRQYAWLERCEGSWYLFTNIRDDSVNTSRKWQDRDQAMTELIQEGWIVLCPYPNDLSNKPDLESIYQGYALIRALH